jgi:hypothetical protein
MCGGALYWMVSADDASPVPEDLRGLDEIDLGATDGDEVRFGSTTGGIVPMVVYRTGRGETSLSLVDVEEGTVLDAGPLPVDGWVADVLPEASDRFVAMTANVCQSELVDTDAGPDCAEDQVPIQLLVYDLVRERWQAIAIGSIPDQWVTLDWVDDATAAVRDVGDGTTSTWATVDLVDPSRPRDFSPTRPTPAGGLRDVGFEKPWVGDGWKMTNPEASPEAVVWKGTESGEPRTVTIEPGKVITAAGRCVLIASFGGSGPRLEHLHGLCAS